MRRNPTTADKGSEQSRSVFDTVGRWNGNFQPEKIAATIGLGIKWRPIYHSPCPEPVGGGSALRDWSPVLPHSQRVLDAAADDCLL